MTIPKAADRLGLTVAMVRRYCKEGQLPAKKIGRDWTVRQGDVERFTASPRKPGRKSTRF
jgi:excisionase family DNA binding protein